MKNLIAIVEDINGLEDYEREINSRRTDDIYFYVNGNRASVSYVFGQLSEGAQRRELEWFLNGRRYEIK